MAQESSAVALRQNTAVVAEVLTDEQAAVMERVLMMGDLAPLSEAERIAYYHGLCRSMRLNPFTKPFEYIVLDNKLTLYALKNCTDQLRNRDRISTEITSREVIDGIYVVTARAFDGSGRQEESTGAVSLVKEGGQWKTGRNDKRYFESDGTFAPLRPDDRANAYMKAETKAKRRATLSMSGLSMLDESELDTIEPRRVRRTVVDHGTGRIAETAPVRALPQGGDEDPGEPPEMDSQTLDWLALIQDARTPWDLEEVGKQMKEAGVSVNGLRDAYVARRTELARMGG